MKKVLSVVLCLMLAISCLAFTAIPASAATNPRYTVLLLDTSYSMDSGNSLQAEIDAAKNFCNVVLADGNTNDYIAIATFSSHAKLLLDFTNNLQELNDVVDKLETDGATNFYEALELADSLLAEAQKTVPNLERNIVLCSDGLPLGGEYSKEGPYTKDDYYDYDYANSAIKLDNSLKPTTTIYTIGFFHSLYGQEAEFAPRFMEDLANGKSAIADNADKLVEDFIDVAETITSEPELESKPEAVATPDTPTNPSKDNSTGTQSTTSAANNASAASVAQAIQTGGEFPAIVVMFITFAALGTVIITSKRNKEN